LLEGADYCFAFYGGAVLSHFRLDAEDGLEDVIPLMKVSRFSAVVMDRDLAPGEPLSALLARKQRIIEGAEKDKQHRLACVTVGREIENEIPPPVFKEVLAAYLRREPPVFDKLTITGARGYSEEVCDFLGLLGDEARTCKSKLESKVPLARAVLKSCSEKGHSLQPWQPYAIELFDLILRARAA
jgi:hypothetical protein